MSAWILLSLVVGSTVLSEVLQSFEMKRHGEITDLGPAGIGRALAGMARRKYLILAVFFMTISFFAFVALVQSTDLSFAVPASAASIVFETILARLLLKEAVDARRWWGVSLVACGVILLSA